MKALLTALACLAPCAAPAQIFADFSTSLGDFTVTLDHNASPRTVANFITLAQGSRAWTDSATGRVVTGKSFYQGLTFHRVIAGFMSQSGSRNGLGTDGPGYTFRDEIPNGLSHSAAYVVSMANSGPNTNGAQFFITAAATSWLDGKHTVFGAVSSGQSIVDAINSTATDANDVPLSPVVIQSVTIRRVGASALAFDEFAQILPTVTSPALAVQHSGASTVLTFTQPARSEAYCRISQDLGAWTDPVSRFLDSTAAPATSLDLSASVGTAPRAFFATSLAAYPPDAVFPSDIRGRTLVAVSANGTFTFVFGATSGGTWSLASPALGGTIQDYLYEPSPYGARLLLLLNGLNYPYLELRLGHDTATTVLLTGRQTGSAAQSYQWLGVQGYSIDLAGSFTLTR